MKINVIGRINSMTKVDCSVHCHRAEPDGAGPSQFEQLRKKLTEKRCSGSVEAKPHKFPRKIRVVLAKWGRDSRCVRLSLGVFLALGFSHNQRYKGEGHQKLSPITRRPASDGPRCDQIVGVGFRLNLWARRARLCGLLHQS